MSNMPQKMYDKVRCNKQCTAKAYWDPPPHSFARSLNKGQRAATNDWRFRPSKKSLITAQTDLSNRKQLAYTINVAWVADEKQTSKQKSQLALNCAKERALTKEIGGGDDGG